MTLAHQTILFVSYSYLFLLFRTFYTLAAYLRFFFTHLTLHLYIGLYGIFFLSLMMPLIESLDFKRDVSHEATPCVNNPLLVDLVEIPRRPVFIRKEHAQASLSSFKAIVFLSVKMKAFQLALKCDNLWGQKQTNKQTNNNRKAASWTLIKFLENRVYVGANPLVVERSLLHFYFFIHRFV